MGMDNALGSFLTNCIITIPILNTAARCMKSRGIRWLAATSCILWFENK